MLSESVWLNQTNEWFIDSVIKVTCQLLVKWCETPTTNAQRPLKLLISIWLNCMQKCLTSSRVWRSSLPSSCSSSLTTGTSSIWEISSVCVERAQSGYCILHSSVCGSGSLILQLLTVQKMFIPVQALAFGLYVPLQLFVKMNMLNVLYSTYK